MIKSLNELYNNQDIYGNVMETIIARHLCDNCHSKIKIGKNISIYLIPKVIFYKEYIKEINWTLYHKKDKILSFDVIYDFINGGNYFTKFYFDINNSPNLYISGENSKFIFSYTYNDTDYLKNNGYEETLQLFDRIIYILKINFLNQHGIKHRNENIWIPMNAKNKKIEEIYFKLVNSHLHRKDSVIYT